MLRLMGDMLKLIWWVVIRLFRSRASLEAEIMALRHLLIVLRRKSPKRLAFSNFDRLIFASLYRIAPNVLNALDKQLSHLRFAWLKVFHGSIERNAVSPSSEVF
jgi:hypothetical protein